MCGRYALKIAVPELARMLGVEPAVDFAPRFNIAPTQNVPVLRDHGGSWRLDMMRWGLVPSWSKGPDSRYAMHNARLEGIESKPAYRGPVRRQRCLIPADGWYEWQKVGNAKQPWYITAEAEDPLCLAGIWDSWRHEGASMLSCSIITGPAQADLETIHHRMPLVLPRDDWAAWLDPNAKAPQPALNLIPEIIPTLLQTWPVSSHVNNARNDDPKCLESVVTN